MSDEDNIIREVEDDLRRERYQQLWNRYGSFVIGTAVVVLVLVVGWQQWQAWQDRERRSEATAFLAATALLDDGQSAAAANALAEVAKESGPGYRLIARMHEAQAWLEAGNPEKALTAYDAVARDGEAYPALRGLAALKGAMLLAESAAPQELEKRLAPALRPRSPWRYAAQEVVAYGHYRAGAASEARTAYQALVNEFDAPTHIRDRARNMLTLIESESAQAAALQEAPAADEAADDTGAPETEGSEGEDDAPPQAGSGDGTAPAGGGPAGAQNTGDAPEAPGSADADDAADTEGAGGAEGAGTDETPQR